MSTSLYHIIREPSAEVSGSAPLLLLLHGLGSNEQDLFSFAPHLDARYRILSVRAPRAYQHGGFAWFDLDFGRGMPQANLNHLERSRQQLLDFIAEIQDKYRVERVYLAGFSQGAIMSYLTLLSQPALVAGVLAMSGYVMKNPALPQAATQKMKRVPVFATHGTRDQVLPVFLGRSTRDYVESLQLNFTYREYDMGHEVNAACFEDCRRWLAEQIDGAVYSS